MFLGREQEVAEVIGLQALAWLAASDDLFPAFLAASGAGPETVTARAADPAFLIAVLDFLMTEDAWLIAFCDSIALPYEAVDRARQMLPGGARVHWT